MQELLSSSSRIICRGAEDHDDFHPKYVPLLSPEKSYLRNKKEKSPYAYFNRCRVSLWQNSTSAYDKNSPESRHRRNIPQHNKNDVQTNPQQTLSLMAKD